VLEEKAGNWFELGKSSESYKYMLFACPVLEHCKGKLPAVIHVDGTARVQLVSKQHNSKFHSLITEFEKLTGVPVVLNTSFNDSEPIVCSPADAINTFLKTRIDALFIGNYFLIQNSPAHGAANN
jgi:carbamoyltransferase